MSTLQKQPQHRIFMRDNILGESKREHIGRRGKSRAHGGLGPTRVVERERDRHVYRREDTPGERREQEGGGKAHATIQKHNHKYQIGASAFEANFSVFEFLISIFKIIKNRMFGLVFVSSNQNYL